LFLAGKWIEVENIILSEIFQVPEAKARYLLSYVEYRPIQIQAILMKNRSC
jgi:hypothetical protein